MIVRWLLVLVGEAVGEERKAAEDHEAVEYQGADGGRQGAVVPGDEDVAEVAVGDDGGAEGDGDGAAESGECPGPACWPVDSGEGFDGEHESDGPDGGAHLGRQSWCPAWRLVGGGEPGVRDAGGDAGDGAEQESGPGHQSTAGGCQLVTVLAIGGARAAGLVTAGAASGV